MQGFSKHDRNDVSPLLIGCLFCLIRVEDQLAGLPGQGSQLLVSTCPCPPLPTHTHTYTHACAQVLLFLLWKDQVFLVTKLLGVAGHGLVENTGLIWAAIGIQVRGWASGWVDALFG